MPSQMLETLLSALNAIQAMPFECPASMKAEVSKVLGDLPSAAQDQMKTGSPLTIKALAGLEGERLAKLVHRTVSLLSRSLVYDRDNGYSSGYSDSYNYSYSDQYTEDTGRKLPARGSSSERKSRGSSGEKSLPSGAVARMDAERVEVLARALEETVTRAILSPRNSAQFGAILPARHSDAPPPHRRCAGCARCAPRPRRPSQSRSSSYCRRTRARSSSRPKAASSHARRSPRSRPPRSSSCPAC